MLLKMFFCLIISIFNIKTSNTNLSNIEKNEMMHSPSAEIEITNLDEYEGTYESINNYLTLIFNFIVKNERINRIKIEKEESYNQIDFMNLDKEFIDVYPTSNLTFSVSLKQIKEKTCISYLRFYDYSEESYFSMLHELTIYSYRMNDLYFISFYSPSEASNYAFQYFGIENAESNVLNSTEIFPAVSTYSSEFDYSSIVKGKFLIKTELGTYYPAKGIKTKLLVFYESGTPVTQHTFSSEVYTDDEGMYLFEVPRITYFGTINKVQLIFYAQTEYTAINNCTKNALLDNSNNTTTYYYESDITYIKNSEYNGTYSHRISDIKTEYESYTDFAFNIAVGINAAGDFCKNIACIKSIPSISIFYPCTHVGTAGINGNGIFLSKDRWKYDSYLHEYGHFAMGLLGCGPSVDASGGHAGNEDLAITYGNKKGYAMAWSEGFASYYSYIVQKTYDYSRHSRNWKKKYTEFKQIIGLTGQSFILRESNEMTVTNVLLSISDKDFKYNNAMDTKAFFSTLKSTGQIDRLGDLLYYLDENNLCDDAMLIKCLAFNRLAPYTLTNKEKIIKKGDDHIFEWSKGSYNAPNDPEHFGMILSNINFTFRLYNYSNDQLVYVTNQCKETDSPAILNVILSSDKINSIFSENQSLNYYWNVQARDCYDSNTQYIFTSENYIVHLDGFTHEPTMVITRNDNSILTLSSNIEYIYNENEKKYYCKFHFYYKWESIPSGRIQDVIILSWRSSADITEFYSAGYYDDNILISTSTNYSDYRNSNYGVRQIYWHANKSLYAQNTFYGETTIAFDLYNTNDIQFVLEYHYFTSTAAAMQGVYVENDSYTTVTNMRNTIQLNYNFLI